MPYHRPTIFAGILYNLAHLDPVIIETQSDKLGREIRTWCRFTTHVFSRTPKAGETGPFITDEGRRSRVFCLDRYALSLHLPAAMAHLANPRRRIWETATERNWLHSAEVNLVLNDEPVGYQVFFAVKKAARADPFDVELTVESAYAFDPARRPKLRGPMLIVGLLTATVEGRKPTRREVAGIDRAPGGALRVVPGYRLRAALRDHGPKPAGGCCLSRSVIP